MYTQSQRTIIAMELARASMRISVALDNLRRNYEAFRTLGESTVRRMMDDTFFHDLMQHQTDFVHKAREATTQELEEARIRQEAQLNNPIRQSLVNAIRKLEELASTNPNPKTYKVLLEYLQVLRSLQLPDSKSPNLRRIRTEDLGIWNEGTLIKRRRFWLEKVRRENEREGR